MKKLLCIVSLIIIMCLTLTGCVAVVGEDTTLFEKVDVPLHSYTMNEDGTDSPEWVTKLEAAQDNNQLIVVAGLGMDKSTGSVSMHIKDDNGNWKQLLSTPAYLGKDGMCLDEDRKADDQKTPIGTFNLNKAFGISPNAGGNLPYVRIMNVHYWSGDPNEGQRYNHLVNLKEYPEVDTDISDHIYSREFAYQFCIDIGYNEECDPDRGISVFIHCLDESKPYTNGSVAISEDMMRIIMKNAKLHCPIIIDTMDNLGANQ